MLLAAANQKSTRAVNGYVVDLMLAFTRWCDKRDILAKVLPEDIRGSKMNFFRDHRNLEELRNSVMHGNEYLTDAQDLSELVTCAEGWITRLQGAAKGGKGG